MALRIPALQVPTVRLVFDRKHQATKNKKGLLQLEVCFKSRRKWASTQVKLYADQWKDGHIVRTANAIELNEWLQKTVSDLEVWLRDNIPFSWEKLDRHLRQSEQSDDFLDFVEKSINERNDIKDSTKRAQRKLLTILREYDKIRYFSDLTRANIMDFDNWLHGRKVKKVVNGKEVMVPMRQQSLFDYHKYMKAYIQKAILRGLLNDDPYQGLRFKRGTSEEGRYLKENELHQLEAAAMTSGAVARARDLFVFQSYTGLSYADLADFDFTKVKVMEGDSVYSGKRKKTGESFFFLLLPKAIDMLKKYDYQLPVISNEGYNQNLKRVAKCAGLDKPLSSHWARRTAACLFINHGIRLEVIAKILGHSDIKTTAEYYARMSEETVAEAMRKSGL